MMIIGKKIGQLGNRLFLYAHLLAAAEEYGVELRNPAFSEYASLFPSTSSDLWCRYPVRSFSAGAPPKWSRNLLSRSVDLGGKLLSGFGSDFGHVKVIRLRAGEQYDLGSEEFASLIWSQHVLLQGWLFRSEPLLAKHADKIRSHFSIDAVTQSRVDARINRLRQSADVVVGIHIRHGDYATYLNGKYFYPTSHYASVMRQIAEQLSPRKVGFLVCGNGELRANDFNGLCVSCDRGGLLEDLYAFADADLLFGPPSTFTGWASFFGKVPIDWLESEDHLPNASGLLLGQSKQAA